MALEMEEWTTTEILGRNNAIERLKGEVETLSSENTKLSAELTQISAQASEAINL
jgi:prefoldin subunit 5